MHRTHRVARALTFLLAIPLLSGCEPTTLTPAQNQRLQQHGPLTRADLPPSPTNAFADDPQAVQLGKALFFDRRMSQDGEIACVTCHDPRFNFSDPRQVSEGVEGRRGLRHAMGITNVGFQPFFFWDGRTDSLWSQPLKAIESSAEMDFSRAEVAHFVTQRHGARYAEVFGEVPDLTGIPDRARPGLNAWEGMDEEERDRVNRVFANVGKALEAYQRQLICDDTRFDRFLRDAVALTPDEEEGAAIFLEAGCVGCHSGPNFSDHAFHNMGIGSNNGVPDAGREDAYERLLKDEFNGAGPYSDDTSAGEAKLATLQDEPGARGAFKTPSLRGVAQRRRFSHRGHIEGLERFIRQRYVRPTREESATGDVDPLARRIQLEEQDVEPLVAFLRTLDCPPLPAELLP